MASSLGHCGRFNTAYRSPICEWFYKDDNLTVCTLRSYERIRENANLFAAQPVEVSTKEKADIYKQTRGVKWNPITSIPIENFVPSPLHVVQGLFF